MLKGEELETGGCDDVTVSRANVMQFWFLTVYSHTVYMGNQRRYTVTSSSGAAKISERSYQEGFQ